MDGRGGLVLAWGYKIWFTRASSIDHTETLPVPSDALAYRAVAFGLASAIGQSLEEQTVMEVAAEYPYLEGEIVAVLVDADLGIRYEHQNVVQTVAASMAQPAPAG